MAAHLFQLTAIDPDYGICLVAFCWSVYLGSDCGSSRSLVALELVFNGLIWLTDKTIKSPIAVARYRRTKEP